MDNRAYRLVCREAGVCYDCPRESPRPAYRGGRCELHRQQERNDKNLSSDNGVPTFELFERMQERAGRR